MKTVIFDMDGIIFDSERATYECWKELSVKYGFENLDIPYMKCIGSNAQNAKKIFLDYYGNDFPFDEYNSEKSRNYHSRYDNGNLPEKKGIRELLSYLRENGFKTAVASSTRVAVVEKQIADAGLDKFFDRIVGGDMISKSKPEPDIFIEADKGFGSPAFVIEDSYNGIRAAKAGGMTAIMVPDMLPANDEMKELADYILNDLLEVKELFVKLGL